MTRWHILALLFGTRVVMAMQFQAVGALSPDVMQTYGVGLAEIGLVIGLYMSPGLFFSLPGSAIGQRFGEKPVVVVALVMMAAGALAMSLAPGWGMFISGQILAGLGGVLLNVLLTKMVADWFAGAEITTALAIFINSWPVGIALALVIFPPLVASVGLAPAFWLLAGVSLAFALAILGLYRQPDASAPPPKRTWPTAPSLRAVLASGVCWGAFNGGLAILFGLGTTLLVSRGVDAQSAARQTSLILWALAIASPFGGVLVDKTGHRQAVIAIGLVILAGLSLAAPIVGASGLVFLTFGIVCGLIAGPIMSLPVMSLAPAERIIGMGLFFTVYYLALLSAPAFAGWLAETTGQVATAFQFAAALQVLALIGLWGARQRG